MTKKPQRLLDRLLGPPHVVPRCRRVLPRRVQLLCGRPLVPAHPSLALVVLTGAWGWADLLLIKKQSKTATL